MPPSTTPSRTLKVASDARAALPTPRSNVRLTPDCGAAVQSPDLSYTAHWEALGSALRLLTTRAISYTGPVWGRGLWPQLLPPTCSRRVCSVGMGPFCYVASLPRSPGPCWSPVFRFAICDGLSLKTDISRSASTQEPLHQPLDRFGPTFTRRLTRALEPMNLHSSVTPRRRRLCASGAAEHTLNPSQSHAHACAAVSIRAIQAQSFSTPNTCDTQPGFTAWNITADKPPAAYGQSVRCSPASPLACPVNSSAPDSTSPTASSASKKAATSLGWPRQPRAAIHSPPAAAPASHRLLRDRHHAPFPARGISSISDGLRASALAELSHSQPWLGPSSHAPARP